MLTHSCFKKLFMLEFKKCQICRESKKYNTDNFRRVSKNIYGLSHVCKTCANINYVKKPRLKKTEEEKAQRILNYSKEYYKTLEGKSKSIANTYRKTDLKKGHENNITFQDVVNILGTSCTYCGFPSTGFDRIDNSKGHILTNCVPSCKECNITRMNHFSLEEMKKIGKVIREVKLDRLLKSN